MDDDLTARFPSLLWGEREWYAALRADDALFEALLDGIFKVTRAARKAGRLPAPRPPSQP